VTHIEGHWRVERVGGLLPPMIGVRKRIHGESGEAGVGFLPGWPFQLKRHGRRVALIYRPSLSTLVDELQAETDGSWFGRTTLGGCELGRFRMTRLGYNDPNVKEGEHVTQDKLRNKLVEYVQNVHAMEQNVLLMLDSMILTTTDGEIAEMLERHRVETRRQERSLLDRLKVLGGLGWTSTGKDLAAIAGAQLKGVADLWRSDKAVRNARDVFVTEQLEIAAYELLERLAERAGDKETAEVARRNRAEEEAMAQWVASNWDRFLDLTLVEEKIRT
jgi:ferritin-like metal-binding protein YciE